MRSTTASWRDNQQSESIFDLVQPRGADGRFSAFGHSEPEVTLPPVLRGPGPASTLFFVGPAWLSKEQAQAILPGVDTISLRTDEFDVEATLFWNEVDLVSALHRHTGQPSSVIVKALARSTRAAREALQDGGFQVDDRVTCPSLVARVRFHRDLADRWGDVADALRDAPMVRFAGGDPRDHGSLLMEKITEAIGLR